jgi:hypothetical protein
MIDYDKFKYRVGDKVRRMVYHPDDIQPAEYEIIAIEEAKGFGGSYRRGRSNSSSGYRHYRLKNLSPGCLDKPLWVQQNIVHSQFEPCNPAAKILYKKNVNTLDITCTLFSSRRAGKSWLYQQFQQYEANRAGEQSDPHSLDALRYMVQEKPSKKVSR